MKKLFTFLLILFVIASSYLNYKTLHFGAQCQKYFGYLESTLAQHENWRDDDNNKFMCKYVPKDECKRMNDETMKATEKHYNERWDYLSEMEWVDVHPVLGLLEAFKLYTYKRPTNIKKHAADECIYKGQKVFVYGEQTRGYAVNPDDHTGTFYVMFENEKDLKNCKEIGK